MQGRGSSSPATRSGRSPPRWSAAPDPTRATERRSSRYWRRLIEANRPRARRPRQPRPAACRASSSSCRAFPPDLTAAAGLGRTGRQPPPGSSQRAVMRSKRASRSPTAASSSARATASSRASWPSGITSSTTPSRAGPPSVSPSRSATSGALVGVALEDRRRALGADHREHGVLGHQQPVGVAERERPAAAALAHAHRHDRGRALGQRRERAGDLAGDAVGLGRRRRVGARRVDQRHHRQAEPARPARTARWARRKPGGRRAPVARGSGRWPPRRTASPATVASPARTTGSVPRSSVHDEHRRAARSMPVGRPTAGPAAPRPRHRRPRGRPTPGSGRVGSGRAGQAEGRLDPGRPTPSRAEQGVDQPVGRRPTRRCASPAAAARPARPRPPGARRSR